MNQFEQSKFETDKELMRFIQEKSDDIEKAVIPQMHEVAFTHPDRPGGVLIKAGMILHMISGTTQIVHPEDAEMVLNDGILNRMKIRIELFRHYPDE